MYEIDEEIQERLANGLLPELPLEVWKDRIRRCRALMEKRGYEAFLVYSAGQAMSGREWVRYFANYEHPLWNSEAIIVIPLDSEPTFIHNHEWLEEQTKEMSPIKDVRTFHHFGTSLFATGVERYNNLVSLLRTVLKEKGLEKSKIGFGRQGQQGDYLPALVERAVNKACAGATLEDASDILWELVAVKTDYDLKGLKRAAEMNSEATKIALESIREGTRESEITQAYLKAACDMGSEAVFDQHGFWCPVWSTLPATKLRSKSGVVFSHRKIKKGDMVSVDTGLVWRGYWSDMARSAVLGEPSDIQKRIHEADVNTVRAMADVLRPGALAGDIAKIAFEVAKKAGFNHIHSLQGHGIGWNCNEKPILRPESTERIKKGMVINLEGGVLVPGVAMSKCEDPYLVTENEPQRLSTLDQELIVR